ncbi:MAG: HDOD domain-containing protein [Methylococcaceae bacterium]|jgi:putative nucleotidyltransferase with HDIG domain
MMLQTYTDLTIEDLLNGDLQLATLPAIYFELTKVLDDPNTSVADVARIIDKDANLSLKLLKLVNSAFFGFPSQISSIDRAINLIGRKDIENLVLSTILIDKFSSLPGNIISMHDFWSRSLRCALLAREICLLVSTPNKLDANTLFICGLLHDIGQLVFFRRIPELAREITMLTLDSTADETDVETRLLGFDHFDTGAELVKLWKLPQIIVDSIQQHEHPEYDGDYNIEATIVRSANQLCKMNTSNCLFQLASLGIAEEDVEIAINKMLDEFEDIFKLFFPTY